MADELQAEPRTGIAPVDSQGQLAVTDQKPGDMTPAQAKIDAIANLTMKVYERASQLQLTPEEIVKLQADFPDGAFRPGASGKMDLLYIEHAYLRDRLNDVFGPGQWSLIPRNRWPEEFTTSKGVQGVRIYVEAMLCVRGCFVGEAIGDMDYYLNNNATNYGDAVEGAKSSALRRCVKELGMGLQAWKKGWCEKWWARNPNGKPASMYENSKSGEPVPTITEDQAKAIEVTAAKFSDKGESLKKWIRESQKVDSITKIPADKHDYIVAEMEKALAKQNSRKSKGDSYEGA